MKFFENQNRLGTDTCAINARDFQNQSMEDYSLWNTYNMKCNAPSERKLDEFAANNNNLNFRNGYGFTTACHVDNDTDLRLDGKLTKEKSKTSLFTRFYQGGPSLGKGHTIPDLESRLLHSQDSGQQKNCIRTAEVDYDRFTPLLPCLEKNVQNVKHVVEPWTHGGDNSRILMRDSNTLRKCGYNLHKGSWRKNC
jgi:hypothetical protein